MSRTKILIAGGGLGGLALAIMLEHLPDDRKVDYLILERSLFSNPLGSAISLHASIIPLLKQIGVWKEVERASKPMSHFSIKDEDGSDIGDVDFAYGDKDDYSYYGLVLSRPELHKILLSHVPPEKILTGKRIVSVAQDDLGVSCLCSDTTIYHGDILIGADGAYSTVRQCLYRDLKSHQNLPRQDFTPIKLDQVVIVGITEQIAWSVGGRSDVLSGSDYWSESQEEGNTSFGHNASADQHSRFPDWGDAEIESIKQICEQMRTKINPFGYGTYGDLIDKTERISKVMFEEKGFMTWYGGRTVLIGDACHKG
ncbi:hypothetical protein BGZ76_005606 [Entomortierella beljakovae]|nr:hypothetical protein BGZ76_005606 [Entomortierella beljakovae]